MKKIFALILCILLVIFSNICCAAEEISTSAKAAIVISADSNDIIYAKNINTRLSMASTTKIMTSLILAEQKDLSKTVKITEQMVRVEGSSMGLSVGDTVTYLDLLYGMLLASGNDAANTTAYVLGGSPEGFAKLMNEKAKQIGLKNTNFVTPSGLDDDNHYSTAYDMAILTAFALKNPIFKQVCSTYTKTLEFGNPAIKRTYQNHNRLLKDYEGMIGVKTGFTKKSGRCLVTAAERDGCTLIAVTLSDPNDWEDHERMLNFGFERVEPVTVSPEVPESIKVISGDCDSVKITAESKSFTVSQSSTDKIETRIFLPKFIYSEISAGQTVGMVEYYLNDKIIGTGDIISLADVYLKNDKLPLKERFIENLRKILRLVI